MISICKVTLLLYMYCRTLKNNKSPILTLHIFKIWSMIALVQISCILHTSFLLHSTWTYYIVIQ